MTHSSTKIKKTLANRGTSFGQCMNTIPFLGAGDFQFITLFFGGGGGSWEEADVRGSENTVKINHEIVSQLITSDTANLLYYAKLRPSSSSSWAELALISSFATGHPTVRVYKWEDDLNNLL